MRSATTFSPQVLPSTAPPAARALFAMLHRLWVGTLDVQLPDGSQARFGHGVAGQPHAAMRLHNGKLCGAVLRAGDIGFAETFIAGDWASSDLVALLQRVIANRDAMEAMVYGTWWGNLFNRARHLFNRNSRSGSKGNAEQVLASVGALVWAGLQGAQPQP